MGNILYKKNETGEFYNSLNCKLCLRQSFLTPNLSLPDMPSKAQHFTEVGTESADENVLLDILQCHYCDLVQLNINPVSHFKEVIRASSLSNEMIELRKNQFSKFVTRYGLRGKTLIEPGCGQGEFLTLFQEAGVNVTGIEYSSESVAICKSKNLKVFQGFLGDSIPGFEESSFTGFFSSNFLEHLSNPGQYLRNLHNLLDKDAVGMIEVPNFDYILHNGLFSEFMTEHLSYFTESTLRLILELNGFLVLGVEVIFHNYVISATVKKRVKTDFSGMQSCMELIGSSINAFVSQFERNSVVLWGAGHQALAIQAIYKMQEQVAYVVDSAKFKQNKLTPGSNIPIKAPETLLSDLGIRCILVMAAGYSDEIARTIITDYSTEISIGILRDYGVEIVR